MDAKKTLKKYVLPGTASGIFRALLLVILILSLLMAAASVGDEEAVTAEFYPDESEVGSMAYIDIAGVSNWLYQYDDAVYYSAEDAEGYLYTVRLKDSQYKAMTTQQTYWDREEEMEPVATYRLEGYVQAIPADVRSSLAESWDITEAEYDQYFGANYLNATTSVNQENSSIWLMVALFSGVIWFVLMLPAVRAKSLFKKCCRQLEDRGLLEQAARQLEADGGHTVIGKNRGILTRDFLFGKGTGAVMAYGDILWAYKATRRQNFVAVNSYLMAATAFVSAQAAIDMGRNDKTGEIETALAVIEQHHPDVIMGYNSVNGKDYRALVKERK